MRGLACDLSGAHEPGRVAPSQGTQRSFLAGSSRSGCRSRACSNRWIGSPCVVPRPMPPERGIALIRSFADVRARPPLSVAVAVCVAVWAPEPSQRLLVRARRSAEEKSRIRIHEPASCGGEGEIRTLEGPVTLNSFRDCRLQPLGHLSESHPPGPFASLSLGPRWRSRPDSNRRSRP
jgi:hypothetical protein